MEQKKDYDYMFKIIMVGSASVGKSQILLRYTKNQFFENGQTTVGVEYATKTITTAQGTRIKFQIWDTAGQEKYRALMKTYYKSASAALLVYDITRDETFLNLDNEQKLIKDYIRSDIITMIVGNKIDLEGQRTVSKQRGLQYAQSKKIAFYQVSAKENTNIELIFTRIAQELEKAVAIKQPSIVDSKQISATKPSQLQNQNTPQKQENIILNKQNDKKRQQASKNNKKCCG